MKAEEIFKRLTEQVPESRELRDRKAAMLMAFAEISGAINDTAERRRRAEEAYRIMQGLVDEKHKMHWLHPIMRGLGLVDEELDNNNLIHGLAMSQLTLGDALESQGDLSAALSAYRSDQATMQRLVDNDPANVRWKRDLAISQAKVGFVLSTQGDLAGASAAFRGFQTDTKTLLEQSAVDPKLQRNLSSSHFLVSYAANESPEQLLEVLREYQATMKRLVEKRPR